MKLSDFPRLRFGVREDFTLIGALRTILRYQGHDIPYPSLMAMSGAAFRNAWVLNAYSASAALAAPESILAKAVVKLGLQPTRIDLAVPDAGWAAIADMLMMGQAVLFWGGRRWRAAGILFGIETDPPALWARTYTDPDDEGRRLPQAAWRQLASEGVEAWAFSVPHGLRRPDTYEILKLASAISHADGDGSHQFGLSAYESWAHTVEVQPPVAGSDAATLCIACVRTLLDARRAAHTWLAGLPRPSPSSLLNAADCYEDYLYMLEELAMGFRHPEQAGGPGWLARRIRAAGQEDARAVSAIQATISIVAL
ncbi:MAG: hypothetical protein H7338_13135 [Candidatus Sericytochromatia bacterium]|nr:hypothetical protein [Candidatus Sericytochromatia bacterium]